MHRLSYITHPTIVRLFGSSITKYRAIICTIACIVNGVVLLLPVGNIESAWEILLAIVAFAVFDVGIFGTLCVVSLWALGYFVAIFSKLIYSNVTNIKSGDKIQNNQVVVEEWTINSFIVIGEIIIVYTEIAGIFDR